MNDASIIELFLLRDEKAIEEAKNKYGRLMTSVTMNLLNQKEDAEECVSSALLDTWNRIPPDKPENLGAYMLKIAKRKAINKLKYDTAKKRNSKLTVSLSELEECFPCNESPSDAVSAKILAEAISRFLREQDELSRNIFIRRYWYTESVIEIAEFYSINENSVATRLFRTRKRLKEYLIKGGYINE